MQQISLQYEVLFKYYNYWNLKLKVHFLTEQVRYSFYPHMPIGKVWIYQLLFVCVCTVTNFSSEEKLAASNFAQWFIGVLGRESHILGNFAPTKAQNQMNRPARKPRTLAS